MMILLTYLIDITYSTVEEYLLAMLIMILQIFNGKLILEELLSLVGAVTNISMSIEMLLKERFKLLIFII